MHLSSLSLLLYSFVYFIDECHHICHKSYITHNHVEYIKDIKKRFVISVSFSSSFYFKLYFCVLTSAGPCSTKLLQCTNFVWGLTYPISLLYVDNESVYIIVIMVLNWIRNTKCQNIITITNK